MSVRKHRSRERPVNAGVRGFFCWRSFPLARRFRAMFSGVAINGRHQLESAILGLSFQTEGLGTEGHEGRKEKEQPDSCVAVVFAGRGFQALDLLFTP